LFLADRAQHVDCIIKPALEDDVIVLCDRHTDSTVAYQGYGRGLDLEQIYNLNKIATSGLKPDLTIVLDVDVETSQSRVGSQKDRMESAGIEFFERVRKGYLKIAKQEPERVKVVDAKQTIEDIHNQILELVGR
jgi:dTMP kinase